MSGTMILRVTTPLAVAVHETVVTSIRAEDASGGFGILPGHADFLTVLDASVLRWRCVDAAWHYCALRGGILRVSEGKRVEVACREAVPGDDLATLDALAKRKADDQSNAARRARTAQTRLHTAAIRSLMRRLGPNQIEEDLAKDFR